MQEDFHYYATYCAAFMAGYSHEDALTIAWSDQFTDCCTRTFLSRVGGPMSAATTQLQMEMMDVTTNIVGLQDITRIWAAFHFLPRDLYADVKKGTKKYKRKYRLICGPNGDLVRETVRLAKDRSLQAAGIAMHVLADTWAHTYFAGTPSLVINNTNFYFYELIPDGDKVTERPVEFRHSLSAPDDPEKGLYTASIYQGNENSIMNLGHGRAGHLPDYSYIRYKYLPAWGDYDEVIKDNPSDYWHAFCQMITAMRYLRGETEDFALNTYAEDIAAPWADEVRSIFARRQVNACPDWKAFAEKLSGQEIPDFDPNCRDSEYMSAAEEDRDDTFLGRYFLGALAQKSMVTGAIYRSGSKLAGISVDYKKSGFKGIKDFGRLVSDDKEEN